MNRDQIARVAHEINRAYCAALGDTSQPAWEQAPDWQKASARVGVDMHMANPDATPEHSHESWLAQKTAEGWKHGKVKDPDKKLHPCCVPYAELGAEQKAKDYLFRAVVHALKVIPAAAPAPSPAFIAVRYIGRREHYVDGAYSTGIVFTKGQSKLVPADKAKMMLTHPDVYEPGEVPAGSAAPAAPPDKKPEDDAEDSQVQRDAIAAMNSKAAVAQFIKVHFNQEAEPGAKLAELKAKAVGLIDQFGMA